MTVVYKAGEQTFKASQVLWAKQELVNAIVEQALISQTEAFIEMIMDGQGDMSRNGINETLRGVKESATDFIGDMMGDLEHALRERMKAVNYGAAVTGIKYDLAGDVTDIEVNVSVGVE
jgi:2-hydroxy-3-keto-5-methylthiopentenyl-1-phosphate phosphatase